MQNENLEECWRGGRQNLGHLSSPHKIKTTSKPKKDKQSSEIENNDTVKREIAQNYTSPFSYEI